MWTCVPSLPPRPYLLPLTSHLQNIREAAVVRVCSDPHISVRLAEKLVPFPPMTVPQSCHFSIPNLLICTCSPFYYGALSRTITTKCRTGRLWSDHKVCIRLASILSILNTTCWSSSGLIMCKGNVVAPSIVILGNDNSVVKGGWRFWKLNFKKYNSTNIPAIVTVIS